MSLSIDKLTEKDVRALRVLLGQRALVGPGYFGQLLWGEGGYRGTACSAPYARQAGKVLNRLKSVGLAEWKHEGSSWGWEATHIARALVGKDRRLHGLGALDRTRKPAA